MKRDKKLILKILRHVRDNAIAGKLLDVPDCASHDSNAVNYHVILCQQAGYLDAVTERGLAGDRVTGIKPLTWQGHEYLEANHDC